jgi:hypothetical protein
MRFSHILQAACQKETDATPENGCLEADAFDREVEAYAMANAVPFETLHLRTEQDAPVIDFGSLEKFFAKRERRYAAGGPKFTWTLGDYFYNQNPLPSCTGHAAGHAFMASNRHIKLHGGSVVLKDINPIGAWYRSKNWSTRGGQSVARMAAEVNEFGNTPASAIGRNNTQPNRSAIQSAVDISSLNQSGICFFTPTADSIIKFVRSGVGCFIGNRLRVSGAEIDRNGLRIAKLGGSWSHSTAFTDYVHVNGTDYVFWLNSWGPIYSRADVTGAPTWGCWMTRQLLTEFLKTAGNFGNAVAVFAE